MHSDLTPQQRKSIKYLQVGCVFGGLTLLLGIFLSGGILLNKFFGTFGVRVALTSLVLAVVGLALLSRGFYNRKELRRQKNASPEYEAASQDWVKLAKASFIICTIICLAALAFIVYIVSVIYLILRALGDWQF